MKSGDIMVSNTTIFKLLKNEEYDRLIEVLNRALLDDNSESKYYFYRFLAYNHDYFGMDNNDIKDAIDLNKAIDLEHDYSYEAEYLFFKELNGDWLKAFLYANRKDIDSVNKVINNLSDNERFLNIQMINLMDNYLINLDNDIQIALTYLILERLLSQIKMYSDDNIIHRIEKSYLNIKKHLNNESFNSIKEKMFYEDEDDDFEDEDLDLEDEEEFDLNDEEDEDEFEPDEDFTDIDFNEEPKKKKSVLSMLMIWLIVISSIILFIFFIIGLVKNEDIARYVGDDWNEAFGMSLGNIIILIVFLLVKVIRKDRVQIAYIIALIMGTLMTLASFSNLMGFVSAINR